MHATYSAGRRIEPARGGCYLKYWTSAGFRSRNGLEADNLPLFPAPIFDLELGGGMHDGGLDAHGFFIAHFFGQPGFGTPQRLLGLRLINIVSLDGHVGEHRYTVARHLHKTVAHGEKDCVLALARENFARDEL